MNATDVYVEQVIIGGLVLLIAVVLWTGDVPPLSLFGWSETPSSIAIAAAAYLAGLLWDRVADTLLERIDKRQRLELAARMHVRRPYLVDPFPEDHYRAAIHTNEHLVRHYNYLRVRMRLTRAVATLAPAGAVALLVHLAGGAGRGVCVAVVAVYAIVAALNHAAQSQFELPRTDTPDFRNYVERDELDRRRSAYAPALIGLLCFVSIMRTIDPSRGDLITAAIALTLLATWVWIRITGTFLAFLRDAQER